MSNEQLVMEKYPKSNDERHCRILRERMQALRAEYLKELNESGTKDAVRSEVRKEGETL